MNDNWDSYFCTVDGKPASVVVNLGLAEEADAVGLPVLCYVSILMRAADSDGFPGLEEEQELAGMEDALVESFHAPDTGRCAGHCLTDGRLDVFFYLESGENWQENVGAVLDHFPSYEWESGSHDDPEWEVYFGFLYPDEVSLLSIQNRRVCDRLEDLGDDLTVSRPLEHLAGFKTREDADAFAVAAREMGFAVEDISREGPLPGKAEGEAEKSDGDETGTGNAPAAGPGTAPEEENIWQARLSRPDCPADSDEISLLLFGLAREHNGQYQGWACASPEKGTG